jgi:AcrR family transcriptional regulator
VVAAQEAHLIPRHSRPPDSGERLLAATATALAEHGYSALAVEHVIEAAGVSRETFDRHFPDKQGAVIAAHECVFEQLMEALAETCETQNEWPFRVSAAIGAALEFAAAHPEQAQLLTVEAVATEPQLARRVIASLDRLADLLGEGRRQWPAAAELPALTEQAQVGAIASVVAGYLANGEPERLPELKPQLAELTLLPYIGAAEAAHVAARST